MDLMDDEDLKKDVISQMMGELDDVTSGDLKRKSPVKGVEIAITVTPKGGDGPEEKPESDVCTEEGCEDPMHDHPATAEPEESEGSDYISKLIKSLG